jgi:glycosyltransferase involved in cell wall biosynthesis
MPEENKKRILIFSTAYEPFVGGAEVAIKEIASRLPDYDWQMITVNLDGRQKSEEQIGNIKVYRLGNGKLSKYFFPWLAYKKARQLQVQNKYDLIWAMMANQAGLAALFFKLKFPQISYLLTLQEGDSEWDIWLRTWFMRPLYKAIYRRADYIQTISNFLANRARKMGAKCPVEVVPNGVIIKNDELRIKNSNLKRVISVSRLVKKNSLEDLVKALVIVNRSSDNPVILKIIGEGKLRSKLEKLIRKLGINNSTIIKKSDKEEKVLEGKVVNKQVYEYLKQADIFVRPSLSEGLGNSFLEAMAMRVPVIGTPVGGIPDFLKDGETGWFCKVKDPQSIAEKINYILDEKNQAEVERVVENAYKLVTEKYTWPKIAEQMNTIFVQLTGKNKK